MSADVLRRAAALMRERANCASRVEPWDFLLCEADEGDLYGLVRSGADSLRLTVAEADYANDAEHIASWHPAVALAVADWLDVTADYEDDGHMVDGIGAAREVARAFLGESA